MNVWLQKCTLNHKGSGELIIFTNFLSSADCFLSGSGCEEECWTRKEAPLWTGQLQVYSAPPPFDPELWRANKALQRRCDCFHKDALALM